MSSFALAQWVSCSKMTVPQSVKQDDKNVHLVSSEALNVQQKNNECLELVENVLRKENFSYIHSFIMIRKFGN